MSLPVVFKPVAASDVESAYAWYETRANDLGSEFIRAMDACIASIARSPEIYPVVHHQIRRALLRKFPCGVFYSMKQAGLSCLPACTAAAIQNNGATAP